MRPCSLVQPISAEVKYSLSSKKESNGFVESVGSPGCYAWQNDVHLVQDVRLWAANPRQNHGWIAIGDEATSQNAKRIASREHPDPTFRPRLEITYRLAPNN